jgi:hypothetical protein
MVGSNEEEGSQKNIKGLCVDERGRSDKRNEDDSDEEDRDVDGASYLIRKHSEWKRTNSGNSREHSFYSRLLIRSR